MLESSRFAVRAKKILRKTYGLQKYWNVNYPVQCDEEKLKNSLRKKTNKKELKSLIFATNVDINLVTRFDE